jgi:hypothetical protein
MKTSTKDAKQSPTKRSRRYNKIPSILANLKNPKGNEAKVSFPSTKATPDFEHACIRLPQPHDKRPIGILDLLEAAM